MVSHQAEFITDNKGFEDQLFTIDLVIGICDTE